MNATIHAVRVFEDQTGFFFCAENNAYGSDVLDATGECFPTTAFATEAAIQQYKLLTGYDDSRFYLTGIADRAIARQHGIEVR